MTRDLSQGVESIQSTAYAFAAKKSGGSVVTWGSPSYGGNSSHVAGLFDVESISSTWATFAAKRTDGTVLVWGADNNSIGGLLPLRE